MNISVTGMSQTEGTKIIFLAFFHQRFYAICNFRNRNDQVFRCAHFRIGSRTFQAVTAYAPNAIVSLYNVCSMTFFANLHQFFRFFIQFRFVKSFYSNDVIIAVFLVRQIQFAVLTSTAHEGYVHKFNGRRVNTGFNDFGYRFGSVA